MTNLREELKEAGWRQGVLLSPKDAEKLLDYSELDFASKHVAVVVSNSCDILHHDLEAEPYVEVLIGEICALGEIDGNYKNRKNPRELHCELELIDDAQTLGLRLNVHCRSHVSRDRLLGISPDPARKLTQETTECIAAWLSDRYSRAALPDQFIDMVNSNKKIGKLNRKLSIFCSEIRLIINPERDLQRGESYSVHMVFLIEKSENMDNKELETYSTNLIEELRRLGMEASKTIRLESDAKYSLHKTTKRWHLDSLSEGKEDHPSPAPG